MTRLLPGVRPLATLYCGAAGVNLRSFLLGALPAQLLWEVFWIALGGVVGVPAARFLNEFEHLLFSFVLLLVLAAIAYGTLLHLRGRGTPALQWRGPDTATSLLIAGGAVASLAAGGLAVGLGLAPAHRMTWGDALFVGFAVSGVVCISLVTRRWRQRPRAPSVR